jgi:hypothetical protein
MEDLYSFKDRTLSALNIVPNNIAFSTDLAFAASILPVILAIPMLGTALGLVIADNRRPVANLW